MALFLYSSIGHFLLLGSTLCLWKHEVKNTIIAATKESDLVKIPLAADVVSLENGKEIEYKNIRYDVVKKDNSNYFCFQDNKETGILKAMFSQFVKKNTDENSTDFSVFKSIFKVYFLENQYFIHFFYKKIKILIFEYPTFFSTFFIDFFKPPCLV